MMNKETLIIYPKKNHFSHGKTRNTLKHSVFLERLFTILRVLA